MQLTHHAYSDRPGRYYIDGRRVSRDTYDLVRIKGRIAHWQLCCLLTRPGKAPPGERHYIHYASLIERR